MPRLPFEEDEWLPEDDDMFGSYDDDYDRSDHDFAPDTGNWDDWNG